MGLKNAEILNFENCCACDWSVEVQRILFWIFLLRFCYLSGWCRQLINPNEVLCMNIEISWRWIVLRCYERKQTQRLTWRWIDAFVLELHVYDEFQQFQ
jgi:hypothetical protein